MKKTAVISAYLLSWFYPISVNVVSILDIKTKLSGPYDFGNDSILFYMFWSFILAVIIFGICFYYIKTRFGAGADLYFTIVNIPLYLIGVYCGLYCDTYPWIATVALVVEVITVLYTVSVAVKRIKN